jgi:hypothetical protein
MADGEVDHRAIALAVIDRRGEQMTMPSIGHWGDVVALMVEAMHDLEAFHGEDVPEEPEDEGEVYDLDLVYQTLDTVRQELVDEAHSGNLARKHHLESAVAAFEDIGTLLRAEEIIRQAFDPREETDELPEDDSSDLHGEGEAG